MPDILLARPRRVRLGGAAWRDCRCLREENNMNKLSKAQQKVLDELEAGAVARYMFGLESYWFINTDYRHCTLQIRKLIELGLVEVFYNSLGYMDKVTAKKW